MPPKKQKTEAPVNAAAAAVWLHVDALTPWKHNPRKNDHAVERVAKNIEALGFGAPIVARTMPDGSHEVIAGHTRLKAMKWLAANRGDTFAAQGTPGPGLVPVRVLEHLTDDQAAALALADNKLSEMSAWDDGMLINLLREIDEHRADTGFSENELEILLAQYEPLPPRAKLAGEIVDQGIERIIVDVAMTQAAKAREAILSILEDAGIEAKVK